MKATAIRMVLAACRNVSVLGRFLGAGRGCDRPGAQHEFGVPLG
jgi:hypothetical protein